MTVRGPWEGYDDFDDDYYDYYDYDEPTWHTPCAVCGIEDDLAFGFASDSLCFDCEDEAEDEHATRRDAKRARASGMQVSGRSIKSVLLPIIEKRGREARRKGGRNAS
jgi:hypothetical protein